MDDQEFEMHRKALEEEGIVVEAKITARSDKENGEVRIGLIVQSDDGKKVNPGEMRVGHDYQVVFFYKGLHPPKPKRPQQRRTASSESTGRPAPDGDSARVKSLGNVGYGHASHGDWQGFLFDISHIIMQDPFGVGPRPVNPVERKNLAADLIRQWCKVESMSEITPGSTAAERFRWLEAAFEAEKNGMNPEEILEAHA